MSRLIISLASITLLWVTAAIAADRGEPIIFSRSALTIEPAAEEMTPSPPSQPVLKKTAEEKKEDSTPTISLPRTAHVFTIDVKPYSQLQAPGIYVQNPVKENTGVLYALPSVGNAEIPPTNVMSPADVLAIAENGMILQIAPSLNQAELAQPIMVTGAVKALLHLPPGTCKTLSIYPHDMARHPLFNPSPTILK